MNPKTITALDAAPMISIEDCRKHLRLDDDGDSPPAHPDDDLVLAYLAAAREWVEGYTGLALTRRTLELALDKFPAYEIHLPVPPVVSVVSVRYTDEAAIEQTVSSSDYTLDDYQRPGWIVPAYGVEWPTAKLVVNAVLVRYTVGYSLYSDSPQTHPLPKVLRQAVLLLLTDLYENRENSSMLTLREVPIGVKSLCDWARVRKGLA
jgi:uncharacterized phiE125 gp8 family phage protein